MRCHGPLTIGAVAALSLLAAGCCGGGSPPVATVGSSATTAQNGLVAYAACMRSHGVPSFPDPAGSGGVPKQAVISALDAVGTSRAEAASNACSHLLGPGGSLSGKASEPIPVQDRHDYLDAALCMRSHGFTDFPDPTFQNNGVTFDIPSSIDTNSSQFTSAKSTCEKLIPPGLPDSNAGG